MQGLTVEWNQSGPDMRDYLLFYVNGKQHKVTGEQALMPLSSYLRYVAFATGTKVVCEEGDCGACSVLVGRLQGDDITYRTVNSCIQYLYQLDGSHIITIEGLKQPNGDLNPVQQSMVDCHGTQCGFCTPGFVVAMCELYEREQRPCQQAIKDALTGNLCRCTGYQPIIEAGLNVPVEEITRLRELYPPETIRAELTAADQSEVEFVHNEHRVYIPVTVEQAVAYRAKWPGATIVAGGTDVCVNMNKRGFDPQNVLSLSRLQGMNDITIDGDTLSVGGSVTLAKLENFVREKLPQLHHLLWLFGSPQIRNAGTLAGNIANASPIADTPPAMFVLDAELELISTGGKRRVKITEFYQGYKKFDMQSHELIHRIVFRLPAANEVLKLYKVSKRKHLDISAFTAAFRISLDGDTISNIAVAYGGVAAVVKRMPELEKFLKGKPFTLDTFYLAGEVALDEITPISDVRGSKEFRNQLGRNILIKFFHEVNQAGRIPACRQ